MTRVADPARQPEHERSIAAEAQELHRHLARDADPGAPFRTPEPEGPARARARRRELYTLVAVCADQVVQDFVAETPPPRLIATRAAAGRPAPESSAAFNDLLLLAVDEFFTTHLNWWRDGPRTSGLEPLLARIDEVGPGASAVLDTPRSRYAERLIQTGMRSMAPVAPGVLSAIATLAGEAGLSTSGSSIARVARRSARVAKQLAALGLAQSSAAQRQLIDDRTLQFVPGAPVRLTAGARGARLELDLGRLDVTVVPSRWRLPASYNHAIGCPALTRLGATAPFDRLWSWTVDVAAATGYLAALASTGDDH